MPMSRLQIDITENPELLKNLMQEQTDLRLRERLHALYLLKSGLVLQEQTLASLLLRGTATIRRWLNAYKRGGLEALLERGTSTGRPLLVPAEAIVALQQQLDNPYGGFESYGEAQKWLREHFAVEVDYKVVHALIKYRLRSSLRVPRPSNAQQDPQAVEAFKKT
jgi:transposase